MQKMFVENVKNKIIKSFDGNQVKEVPPNVIPEAIVQEDDSFSLKRLEWENIQRVLAENNGNISATARQLKMHRRTLQRKLEKRPIKN